MINREIKLGRQKKWKIVQHVSQKSKIEKPLSLLGVRSRGKKNFKVKVLKVAQSCPTLCDHMVCPWNSPGNNTGVDCHFLLQGIFPTQESNLDLLHCRLFSTWATREALRRTWGFPVTFTIPFYFPFASFGFFYSIYYFSSLKAHFIGYHL